MTERAFDAAAHNRAVTAPAKALTLTDLEVNLQMGRGEIPHGVTHPAIRGAPDHRQPAPEAAGSEPGDQTVKVGARDVVRPTESLDEAREGEGSLYDRLAKKDNTPTGPGGESGAA